MAEGKLKVNLHWGARNTNKKFRIGGRDLESVAKALSTREEWGSFAGSFTHKWKGDAKGNASVVNISPTFTIKMPTWQSYRDQPQACKDEWDRMWVALKKHEEGHRKIFERGIVNLVRDLEALGEPTGTNIDRLMKETGKAIQDGHNAFDRKTENGKARGVELTITSECASKP